VADLSLHPPSPSPPRSSELAKDMTRYWSMPRTTTNIARGPYKLRKQGHNLSRAFEGPPADCLAHAPRHQSTFSLLYLPFSFTLILIFTSTVSGMRAAIDINTTLHSSPRRRCPQAVHSSLRSSDMLSCVSVVPASANTHSFCLPRSPCRSISGQLGPEYSTPTTRLPPGMLSVRNFCMFDFAVCPVAATERERRGG